MSAKTFVDALATTPEEIAARRAQREEKLTSRRARISLLQNLADWQRDKFDRLIEDVLNAPRDDGLREALTRLDGYLARRWRDPRNEPAPIPAKSRTKIVAALEKAGVPVTDETVYEMAAGANK